LILKIRHRWKKGPVKETANEGKRKAAASDSRAQKEARRGKLVEEKKP